MKYWIFGHTHDYREFEEFGIKCICNPLGYPSERKDVKVNRIEIPSNALIKNDYSSAHFFHYVILLHQK